MNDEKKKGGNNMSYLVQKGIMNVVALL